VKWYHQILRKIQYICNTMFKLDSCHKAWASIHLSPSSLSVLLLLTHILLRLLFKKIYPSFVKQNTSKLDVCLSVHRAASLCLVAHPAALHLTPDNQQLSTAHHRWQQHTYSLELLMMGIEVPETC